MIIHRLGRQRDLLRPDGLVDGEAMARELLAVDVATVCLDDPWLQKVLPKGCDHAAVLAAGDILDDKQTARGGEDSVVGAIDGRRVEAVVEIRDGRLQRPASVFQVGPDVMASVQSLVDQGGDYRVLGTVKKEI